MAPSLYLVRTVGRVPVPVVTMFLNVYQSPLLPPLLPLPPQLLDPLLEVVEPPLVELDPLAGVADHGVLQQRAEHHEEAHGQVDVQRLHVRDFWQRSEQKTGSEQNKNFYF